MFIYARGGFLVRHALMGMEFEKVKDLVPLVEVNTTVAREHVCLIEQKHQTRQREDACHDQRIPFRVDSHTGIDTYRVWVCILSECFR